MDNGQEGTLQQAKYASAVRPAPLSAEPIIPPGCHRALGSGRNEKSAGSVQHYGRLWRRMSRMVGWTEGSGSGVARRI